MNIFDIIVYVALVWAVISGWRKGFLLQMASFIAVIVGLFLALEYGKPVGLYLGFENPMAAIVGFLVIFLSALVVITIAAYLMRTILRFSGLGKADVILGILFSVVKISLIVGVLFSGFAVINREYTFVERHTVEESYLFTPMVRVVDTLTPYFEDLVGNIVS